MRKSLLVAILVLGVASAKAQTGGIIEYKPATIGGSSTESTKSLFNSATPIDAYYIDNITNKPVKVKLKVIENKYGVFILGCKKLTDYEWSEFSEPSKASKLAPNSKYSEYFEYQSFVGRLQKTVYF